MASPVYKQHHSSSTVELKNALLTKEAVPGHLIAHNACHHHPTVAAQPDANVSAWVTVVLRPEINQLINNGQGTLKYEHRTPT